MSNKTASNAISMTPNLSQKLLQFARDDAETVLAALNTSLEGLSDLQSRLPLEKVGLNEIAREKPPKWYVQLLKTFQNPLVILLMSRGADRRIFTC